MLLAFISTCSMKTFVKRLPFQQAQSPSSCARDRKILQTTFKYFGILRSVRLKALIPLRCLTKTLREVLKLGTPSGRLRTVKVITHL